MIYDYEFVHEIACRKPQLNQSSSDANFVGWYLTKKKNPEANASGWGQCKKLNYGSKWPGVTVLAKLHVT
jgi:hypothetical protein